MEKDKLKIRKYRRLRRKAKRLKRRRTIFVWSWIWLRESTKNVPIIGNAAICTDSVCTTGHPGINFYCSPNPVSKAFFGASCLCGVLRAASSSTALVTSFAGIPVKGWVGSFGARAFNRLGKYTLHMGNLMSGNVTNITQIGELMLN